MKSKYFVAIAAKNHEYLFRHSTAHLVPARSRQRICDTLNAARYKLKDGEVWHVFEDSMYYDMFYEFYIRSNKLFEKRI